jgi:hypothetical protein
MKKNILGLRQNATEELVVKLNDLLSNFQV